MWALNHIIEIPMKSNVLAFFALVYTTTLRNIYKLLHLILSRMNEQYAGNILENISANTSTK